MRLAAVVEEELHAPDLSVDARKLLPGAKGLAHDRPGVEVLQLRAHEGTALAGLHVLELDDAPHRALVLDVHAVPELVRGDDLGHAAARYLLGTAQRRAWMRPWPHDASGRCRSRRRDVSRSGRSSSTARRTGCSTPFAGSGFCS